MGFVIPNMTKTPRPNEIRDRAAIADHVMDWIYANAPSASIDTVLTWPDLAQRMGRDVCRKMGRKINAQSVHEVCRAALSSRKRGDLRRDRT